MAFLQEGELYGSDLVPVSVNPKLQQFQEVKEILAEVLGIDIPEVEDMIQRRMGERTWLRSEEKEELWPQML